MKELAEEAGRENTTMRKLTEKSTQDAAAVKVLTMITLIYLPATVVSVSRLSQNEPMIALLLLTLPQNFFSTQFVGQEQGAGGSNKVIVSSNAWLFAAVSVPLTLVTLAIWWLWVRFQAHERGVGKRHLPSWRAPWRKPNHQRTHRDDNFALSFEA